jgi:hypothetical protein
MRLAMCGMLGAGLGGLLLTMGIGLGWVPADHRVAAHWQVAIWTVLLLLSAHTLVLFYFLATGKQLRVLMQGSGREVNSAYLLEMRLYKAKVFPPLMLALGVTIATFVLGGGVLVGTVPRVVHLGTSILALLTNLFTAQREVLYLSRNSRLIRKIELEYLTG